MRTLLVAAMYMAVPGCGGSGDDDDATGGGGEGDDVRRGDPDAPLEVLEGAYELHTTVDLTAAGVLPDYARNTVRSLSRLHEAPSAAMMEILERSGAPILSTVLWLIPASLQEYLASWIDEWIVGSVYDGSPATEQIAALGDEIGSLFTAFELETQLEVAAPDDQGAARATHALTGASFWLDGEAQRIDATPWADPPVDLDARAVHVLESAPGIEAGVLDLGDHALSVPLGALALQVLPELLEARFGVGTIRDALGLVVDCDGMASWIGGQCVLEICVGNEAEIAELCGTALDELANDVEAGIQGVELRAVHLKSGSARMWDEPWDSEDVDGVVDSLDGGSFRMGLNLGAGERPTTATFWGARRETATDDADVE